MSQKNLQLHTDSIVQMFQGFGIEVTPLKSFENLFREYHQFELAKPARMQDIRGYLDDLKYVLGREDVVIQAPVPGKRAIEVNVDKSDAGLERAKWADLLQTPAYKRANAFATPIGVNAVGAVQFIDLVQTPHVLVLSTFGYDRTMIMNEIICSIIARTTPAESRFLLIDPMMINFYNYKDLPHLLIEPIHDAKQSIMSIRWIGKEMERRASLIADAGVSTVDEYNAKCKRGKRKAMMLPRIVIAIHEIGDMMMTDGIDMSVFLMPLLEKAHLVGIHLVCGTAYFGPKVMRPSMLASFPGVVTFGEVPSDVEQAAYGFSVSDVGYCGDLYYRAGTTHAAVGVRQSHFWSADATAIVESIKDAYSANATDRNKGLKQASDMIANLYSEDDDDDLYEKAKRVVIKAGKASTSHIQRMLRIGYSRAARLMSLLEKRGVIGPPDGSNPREVLE